MDTRSVRAQTIYVHLFYLKSAYDNFGTYITISMN